MLRCGRLLLALAIMVATSFGAAAQQQPTTAPPAAPPAATAGQPDQDLLKPEQLEALVAPIALYPDALLANMLAAATYPLEVVEADRWIKEKKNLKGDALKAEVDKKSWDDSVKALTATPSVLDMMSDKLDWTKSLGDAMLAQQADLMDAIRKQAERFGAELVADDVTEVDLSANRRRSMAPGPMRSTRLIISAIRPISAPAWSRRASPSVPPGRSAAGAIIGAAAATGVTATSTSTTAPPTCGTTIRHTARASATTT